MHFDRNNQSWSLNKFWSTKWNVLKFQKRYSHDHKTADKKYKDKGLDTDRKNIKCFAILSLLNLVCKQAHTWAMSERLGQFKWNLKLQLQTCIQLTSATCQSLHHMYILILNVYFYCNISCLSAVWDWIHQLVLSCNLYIRLDLEELQGVFENNNSPLQITHIYTSRYLLTSHIGWSIFNGWQLAKMKKSIPDMSLP